MNITSDVVNDLLPVYLAGEASQDTRAFVEEYLRDHPDLARSVSAQAAKTAALLTGMAPTASEVQEKTVLERVRRFSRNRTYVLGFAIAYTLVPLTFTFDSRGIAWVMLRDNPKQALFFWVAALGCWLAYYVMGRRLRNGTV